MIDIPNVTIIIINNNYQQYVIDAIESALSQNYYTNALTVYVVDDGSTDESCKIIDDKYFNSQYDANFSESIVNNIKLKFKKLKFKTGPSRARNIAITETLNTTDIYAILDADDIYYVNKVVKLVSKLMESPFFGVAYADYDILNVESETLTREFKEPYSRLRLMENCIVHSGALIKKEALLKVAENGQFYDELMRTCEDYDLWVRISEHYCMVHVPESLSLVRVHNQNSTTTVSKAIWQKNWDRIRYKLQKRLQNE